MECLQLPISFNIYIKQYNDICIAAVIHYNTGYLPKNCLPLNSGSIFTKYFYFIVFSSLWKQKITKQFS